VSYRSVTKKAAPAVTRGTIAQRIIVMGGTMEQGGGYRDWTAAGTAVAEPNDLVLAARSIVAAQAVLTEKMPPGFVGQPALVILLHRFLGRGDGRTQTMSDLVTETGLPQPSIARWCKALEDQGLLHFDAAVDLTEAGVRLVVDTLTTMIESQARLLGMPRRG